MPDAPTPDPSAADGMPIITNDMLPTDTIYRTPGQIIMSRLTLGRMRTTLDAPEGCAPLLRLSFREWRRWKLRADA